jgi:hypothetical protein
MTLFSQVALALSHGSAGDRNDFLDCISFVILFPFALGPHITSSGWSKAVPISLRELRAHDGREGAVGEGVNSCPRPDAGRCALHTLPCMGLF